MVALVRETLHGKREGDEVQGQAKARRLVRTHRHRLLGKLVCFRSTLV